MEEEKVNIKEKIIETATILFAEKGFDGLSMDELAKSANVNKSMIYYYFSSKDGLLINIIQKHFDEFESLLKKIEIRKSSDIIIAVKDIISLAVDYISKNKSIMTILMQEMMLKTPKTRLDIFNFINPMWDKLEKTLRLNLRADVSFMDKMLAVTLIINYVLIMNRMEIDNEEDFAHFRSDYVDRITDIIVKLLGYPKK